MSHNFDGLKQDSYCMKEDTGYGVVKIADEVVANIAGIAAMDVEGIFALGGNEILQRVKIKNPAKGVKVEVTNKTVKCDLSLVVAFGYQIPVVSQKVQEKVKTTIENMTGLEVTDVNIHVEGVSAPKVGK